MAKLIAKKPLRKTAKKNTKQKYKSKPKLDVYSYDDNEKQSSESENEYEVGDENDSIDDEGSDVGWNEDDEMMYGKLFSKKNKDEDEVDEDDDNYGDGTMLLSDMLGNKNSDSTKQDSNSEADSESDGDHDKLLSAISSFSKSSNEATKYSKNNSLQHVADSEYSAIADNRSENVSLETLLGALSGTSGLKGMRQRLTDLEKAPGPPKHVHKVVAERIERNILYKDNAEDIAKWQSVITENKHASSLDLAKDVRQLSSYRKLVKEYEPTTPMEQAVQMVLLSTSNENAIQDEEENELQERNISLKEIKQRQAELSKVKALMFYEQMKRHRVNKIKSKAYHRILKRKKIRLNKNGEELQEGVEDDGEEGGSENEEGEDAATKRVKERMNLKHQNTGKWAKMALQYGKGDKSLRAAYHESVELGHELTKKANSDGTEKGEGEGGFDDDAWEAENAFTQGGGSVLTQAHKAINQVLGGSGGEEKVTGKFGKLFEMDFMKRAANQQKERAREEAQLILRDLDAIERADDSDAGLDDRVDNNSNYKKERFPVATKLSNEELEKKAKAKKDILARLSGGSGMVISSWNDAIDVANDKNGNEMSTNELKGDSLENPWLKGAKEERNVHLQTATNKAKRKLDSSSGSILVNTFREPVIRMESEDVDHKKKKEKRGNVKSAETKELEPAPQFISAAKVSGKKTLQRDSKTSVVIDDSLISNMENSIPKVKNGPSRKPLLMQKSQEDLVAQAFSGPDYEEEFKNIKRKAIDEELDIDEKKKKILSEDKAGWGDWAGPGMTGVSAKVVKKRQILLKDMEDQTSRLRAGRTDSRLANVILSERRIKTASKFKISDIPHPFTSREEYERSLQMPLGEEWNASHIVRKNTKPEIMLRAGRVIDPIKLPKQKNSQAATLSGGASKMKK